MTFTDVIGWFTAAHTMQLLLAMMIFLTIYVLVKLSLNPNDNLNLSDLVTVGGRLDEKKFTRFGAWVISTWAFIYLIVNKPEQFPEWYFVGYMGVWVSNAIFDKYMTAKEMNAETHYAQRYGATPIPRQPDREL